MSVADALRDATVSLSTISDTPRLDAELLMAHALGIGRNDLLLRQRDLSVRAHHVSALDRHGQLAEAEGGANASLG